MSVSIHQKYLAVGPEDLRWGMAVNSVGYQESLPMSAYPPEGHNPRYLFSPDHGRTLNEYQLIYIVDGKGIFSCESLGRDKVLQVNTGDMIILFPGEWHSYRPDSRTGWKEYWIGFDGQTIKDRDEAGFFSRENPILHVGYYNGLVDRFKAAIDTANLQKSGFQQRLAGIADYILSTAFYLDRNQSFKTPGISGKISTAKKIIAEQYQTISAQEIADTLCMSYSNFRKTFKQYTGFSPAQYILDVRMNKVKEILTNTSVTVKEIAKEQGFDNYEYFLTAFKANSGVTPSQYREMTQGENISSSGLDI